MEEAAAKLWGSSRPTQFEQVLPRASFHQAGQRCKDAAHAEAPQMRYDDGHAWSVWNPLDRGACATAAEQMPSRSMGRPLDGRGGAVAGASSLCETGSASRVKHHSRKTDASSERSGRENNRAASMAAASLALSGTTRYVLHRPIICSTAGSLSVGVGRVAKHARYTLREAFPARIGGK